MMSRMRSSPANASVICVPIDAIWITGSVTSPTRMTYRKRSPVVMRPARISRAADDRHQHADRADDHASRTPSTADVPVIVLAMFRKSRCAPLVNTISSRFSAVYTFTTRAPPSACTSRPDTSA